MARVEPDAHIVDRIEVIRRRNNGLWMDLVRLSLRLSPEETKDILRLIAKADRQILDELEELSK